eukprot:6199829-Pleurochrysis_carterae.AAC.2
MASKVRTCSHCSQIRSQLSRAIVLPQRAVHAAHSRMHAPGGSSRCIGPLSWRMPNLLSEGSLAHLQRVGDETPIDSPGVQ